MQIANLIMALPGAAAQGLIWGIMAIGVYLTFRVLDIADLTVDGTMCTGGAVCVMMMISGHNVWVSLLVATLAGMVAGGVMVFVWKYLIAPMGGAWGIYELLPAFIVALVLIVVVSLLTKAPDADTVATFDKVKADCKK